MCTRASRFRLPWSDVTISRTAFLRMLFASIVAVTACSDEDPLRPPTPAPPRTNADVVSPGGPMISAGGYTTCGVRTDARIVCWGDTRFGQSTVPVGLGPVTQVAVSEWHTCALKATGQVACWGAEPDVPANGWINEGQTIVPFSLPPVSRVSVGGATSCAITATGTVTCWGSTLGSYDPPPLSGITDITVGREHACALLSSGIVTCWGSNIYNQQAVPAGLGGVTQIAAGHYHTCAVKADGTVTCWGGRGTGDVTAPDDLTGATHTASGADFACAARTDGTVRCWGRNDAGQASPPAGLSGVIQITAGVSHACALKADFSTVCWGYDLFGATEPRSIVNRPPVITPPPFMIGIEGGMAIVPLTVSDPDGDPITYRWNVNGLPVAQPTPGATLQFPLPDNGTYTVALAASDAQFTTNASLPVYVQNVPPTLGTITAPALPVAAGANATVTGTFTDPGLRDTHVADVQWGAGMPYARGTVSEGGKTSPTFSATRTNLGPGVYPLSVRITDNDGDSAQRTLTDLLVIYDPSAGYVTGKGAIQSPAGACQLTCYGAEGRATFGFTSKYESGATKPSGTTQFQFKAGNLDFASVNYQWLVVAGVRAQYKGEGTINGGGTYGFLLTAIDGDLPGGGGVDKFRIKIWDRSTGLVVYDNQMGASDSADASTAVASGGIIIKK